MGLVVNTNVPALNTSRILRRSTLSLNKSLERLSSGLRINRAADDAAGLAISESLRSRIRGLAVAQRNAQDGISLVQTAEGALSEVTNQLQRIRELAVQAANGTNSAQNRVDLNAEVAQLIQQIENTAQQTVFNGVNLLNGAFATISLHVGASANQTLDVALQDTTTGAAGINIAGNTLTTVAGANTTITAVDAALIEVNTARANLGAAQNRLEFTINTLAIEEENSAFSESAIRDADIAKETIQFTRNQILVSAGTSVLAQANLVPQSALQLLGG
jgi:flagellin